MARERAEEAAEGVQREVLLRKALAAENVAQLESFLTGGPAGIPAPARAKRPSKLPKV
ncbi:hypothetical protein [Bradyrhizobium sp. NBAIM01]|uniref:hypothetical protein n=1 Tax=Bradyrhizobium sp. NBAIM01 TaxID=2793818 RepID=UPI001CD294E3|nr:hypothetical protein [Bradyrhizobium sp. NBAIM01]MCA1510548.1 hypothetical protein [Bradyrhizobium sp. NBAIM01]